MTDYNNQAYQGQPYAQAAAMNAFNPERVGSGGIAFSQQQQQQQHVPSLAGKRPRRLRSTQGAAHYGNGQKGKKGPGASNKVEYHDRKTAAPIFLQKTFEMINRCDNDHQHLAGWTPDGKMFVIKDQKVFSEQIIPQFFDHNKFTSFARQLNFYGFRKMQSKSIYKGDVDKDTAKYVTFFNEKFQRDRPDLLKEIQRSTKGGQNNNISQEQQREINALKDKVARLEQTIQMMQNDFSGRLAALETQMYQYASYSSGQHAMSYSQTAQNDTGGDENYNQGGGDNGISNQTEYPSPTRINNETNEENTQQPTLAPHPNSKVLPDSRVLPAPPRQSSMRMDSFLRGFSQASLPDLAPFEQKYFQNAISGPDPVDGGVPSNDQSPAAASGGAEAPVPQLNKPGGLTRQLSEGLQRLDLSLSEFPALSSV